MSRAPAVPATRSVPDQRPSDAPPSTSTTQQAAPTTVPDEGPEAAAHPLSLSARWIAVMLSVAAMYVAKPMLLPLVAAFLVGFLLRPLIRFLDRAGLPAAIGALLVIVMLTASLAVGAIYLKGPFDDWVTRLPGTIQSVQGRLRALAAPLSQVSEATKAVDSLANERSYSAPPQVELKGQSWSMWLLSNVQEIAVSTMVMLLALYFILAAGDRFLQRLISMIPGLITDHSTDNLIIGGGQPSGSGAILAEMEKMAFSYLGTITTINILLGAAVAVSTWLCGMGTPLLWGVMACVLNFLPYIGPLLGVLILSLASVATFDGMPHSALPPLAYVVLITIESNFITPMALGRRLAMSPLVLFIWLLFMGWLWGIAGALIAVPLLMVIKIVCESVRTLRWVALLIEP
jgi:predicted PurR-regulated permease PerM